MHIAGKLCCREGEMKGSEICGVQVKQAWKGYRLSRLQTSLGVRTPKSSEVNILKITKYLLVLYQYER